MYQGFIHLSTWGYVGVTLALMHISIIAVTIFLHRSQAHRSVSLHPILSHFFRFWLWLTTGIITKEWVAVHRKHHTCSDAKGDPHSPQVDSLKAIFFGGFFFYRRACRDRDMIKRYGNETPDDWLERKVYTSCDGLGLLVMLSIDLFLFGFIGLIVWGMQIITMPLFSAGVVNGIGHYWGYRNFECSDSSTNLIPFGIIIGGEELHNNHHAFSTSAKLSSKWWEFDIGWMYIWIFSKLGLARPKRLIPQISWKDEVGEVDLATLQALLINQFHVMNKYAREVLLVIFREERSRAGQQKALFARGVKKLLKQECTHMSDEEQCNLKQLLTVNQRLETVYQLYVQLQEIWKQTRKNREELLENLQAWCDNAEETGIAALKEFVADIKQLSVVVK